jgi:hypothetical protein
MAFTIPESFARLKSNLEITGLQKNTVSERQVNVRAAVENSLGIIDSFLTGSYARSTMIAPLKEADVDVFVVLKPQYFHHYNNQNGGPPGLLELVKRTIKRTYPTTPDISRNGQAVTIRFSDFVVDVVPAFERQGGGFLIPNSITRNWLSTDPKKHVEIAAAANVAHNGDLVPLIKMIKAWNRNAGRYFRSFHLEVLALRILDRVAISDFPSGMRYFFDKGRDLITKQNPDPAGYGGDVGNYINTQENIQEATAKFNLAYDRALKAEDFAARDRILESVDEWRKIFGDYFPAYG